MTAEYELHLGDCLELMQEIPDGSIDFICCDPPYGTTNIKWDEVLDFEKLFISFQGSQQLFIVF